MPTVLVVDDEAALREPLTRALRHEGFDVLAAEAGLAGLAQLCEHHVDAVVLDVSMPLVDGFETCRRIRAAGNEVPVLMLTGRGAVEDRVAGFEAGADDYVIRPFALRELILRLRAIIRRAGRAPASETHLAYADLWVDRRAHRAWRGARELRLSRTEFALLGHLLGRAEQVVTRSQIHSGVWGYDPGRHSNSLGVYVGYLRRKLEAGGEPRLLHTVRGAGYVLRV